MHDLNSRLFFISLVACVKAQPPAFPNKGFSDSMEFAALFSVKGLQLIVKLYLNSNNVCEKSLIQNFDCEVSLHTRAYRLFFRSMEFFNQIQR